MIIQILSNLREEGYLNKGRHPTVAPFFAGANVAFRREALDEVGGFDPACKTGEDCDLCVRLSAADKELYLRRSAVIRHRNPSTLRHLVRQWYGYGRYHPYVFAKHNERAAEAYVRLRQPADGELYSCVLWRRFPVGIVLFVTKFLMMHVIGLASLVVWLLGWTAAAWAGLVTTLLLAGLYVWPEVRRWGLFTGGAYAGLRYCADLALFVGAFIGGLRERMLYFSATID
jgi:cellulose synthase/poly-beta-1,6-N-acetylglucosamine synthase-like glycosyltransferase